MSICIDPGYGAANGPCAILSAINVHGVVLTTCDEQFWIPAACPDLPLEGAISLGAKTVKIATVNGATPSICVQRDSNGVAQAKQFMVVGTDCVIAQQSTLVAYQHVSVGPAVPGVAAFQTFQSHMRLRGNGDLDTYGGSDAVGDVYGVFKIGRKTGRDGNVEYINSCSLLANAADHYWWNLERPSNLVQDLMKLTPTTAEIHVGWTLLSDDRFKKNNRPIAKADSTQKVKNLIPQEYELVHGNGEKITGFVYSNIKQFLPEAATIIKRTIAMDGEGEGDTPVQIEVGAIRPNDILAFLTSAVQDIIDRVEALEAHGNGNPNGK